MFICQYWCQKKHWDHRKSSNKVKLYIENFSGVQTENKLKARFSFVFLRISFVYFDGDAGVVNNERKL